MIEQPPKPDIPRPPGEVGHPEPDVDRKWHPPAEGEPLPPADIHPVPPPTDPGPAAI